MDKRTEARPTVVITDDHAIVRDGLRLIAAAAGIDVVGEATDVPGARQQLLERRPDVLVLDLNLGGDSALSALADLRAASPATAVVILTMQKEPAYARRALEGGAAGYVLKESAGAELVRAIRMAAAGETYLQPEIGAQLLLEKQAGSEPLTDREREILALIGLGHTNAEISKQLYLSVRTVESHRARIQDKLGVSGRAELIRYALEEGLIER
jgi:two-component system response regulator NreC